MSRDYDTAVDGLGRLEREGLAWVDQLLSGEVTGGQADRLRCWRAQSAAHERAFARAVKLRGLLRAAAPAFVPAEDGKVAHLRRRSGAPSRRALLGGFGVAAAASVAGLMAVDPPMQLWPSLSEIAADYRTGVGERRAVRLGAGVALELNTRTSVQSPASWSGGRAALVRGEALAAVAGRPFVFEAGGGRVSTANASFNIKHVDDVVCVTCLAGRVRVEHDGRALDLGAGQQATYDPHGLRATDGAPDAAAWRRGLIVFHGRPFREVVADVNRYRTGQIVLANAALGRRRVSGVLRLDRLDDIFAEARLNGAAVVRLPGGMTLIG